ncbi:MAG: ABC transporter permease [Nitriliruptoraceae bacterium]
MSGVATDRDVVRAPLRGRRLLRAVLAQAALELRLLVRAGESLVITFGIPLGILGFFSVVDVLPTASMPAVDFLVPGVLAISVAATGLVATGIQTAFERRYGVLKRLGATPLPTAGFLLAKSLAVAGLLTVQTVLVVGLALALGWSPASWWILPGGLLLGAIACTSLGLLMAGTLRAEATLAATNALFLVLLMISGVAFEAATLPDGLAAVGQLLPLGALGTLLRDGLAGHGFAAGPAVTLTVWSVLAIAAATRWFRWEP